MPSHRLWGFNEDGNIKFESLTAETLDGALKLIQNHFFPDESISRAVEITSEPGADDDLIRLCLEVVKDGVSVVAIDVLNLNVVGAAINKIQYRTKSPEEDFYENFKKTCKCKSSKALIDFMIDMDCKVNLWKQYNANCLLEMMFVATSSKYRQQGICKLLIATSLQISNELKRGQNVKIPVEIEGSNEITNAEHIPALCSAIATSLYSLKSYIKFDFDKLVEVSYDDYEYNGKKFSRKTGNHKSTVLVAKKLI